MSNYEGRPQGHIGPYGDIPRTSGDVLMTLLGDLLWPYI